MSTKDLITIDGSSGEGGGQVLRSSLGLSLATGKPFRINRIRAGRSRPGLGRQHLTALLAAKAVGRAQVRGDEMRSTDVTFVPRGVVAGEHEFAVGTAGSATLVLQTVLPALLTADGPSRVVVSGGTHNRAAPPFEFLDQAFLPLVNRMGPRVNATLERPGFEPAGGGRLVVDIEPSPRLEPLVLDEAGDVVERTVTALVAHLDEGIGDREIRVIRKQLGWDEAACEVRRVDEAECPGNAVLVTCRCANTTEIAVGFGRHGARATKVGNEAAQIMKHFLASESAVGRFLADQLLLPLALAGGGRFTTQPLSGHAETQIATIARFLPVDVEVVEQDRHRCLVTVKARG